MVSMTLSEALDWLYSTQFFGIKLGLENTRALIAAAQIDVSGAKVIHVAGTNGKGSTCAMIEAIARESGLKTGLFTSPHLVDFAERIRVNGEMIPDDELLEGICFVRELAESVEQAPTFFELALILALRHFMKEGVELIILETGMGGRLDATNAVAKDVAVLTPIGLDHQQYLGDTLAAVAAEKAAIIAPSRVVVTAAQEPQAMKVITETATAKDALLILAEPHERIPQLALAGPHQRQNAAVAMEAFSAIHRLPSKVKLAHALGNVDWPGRFEQVKSPAIILDGAHNAHAARVLVETWKEKFGDERAAIVFAASADKQIQEMLPLFDAIVGEWHLVPCSSPRILPVGEMAELLAGCVTTPIYQHESLEAGLRAAEQSELRALAAGSLFLLGDIKAHIKHQKKRQTVQ